MTEKMRILIAYDGSAGSNAMLDDLHRAGLPTTAEVEVVSVAETWFPLPASIGGVDTGYARESVTGVDTARELSKHAHNYLKLHFPKWQVSYAAAAGSPTGILLGQAENWKPDLIVVGARGQTALSDIFLGHVSQKVSAEAHCPVRVARGREDSAEVPIRLVIGIDGSPGSEAAVAEVAKRHWPAGTEVRIVNALWNLPPPSPDLEVHETFALQISEWVASENARIREMIERSKRKLAARGLKVTVVVREADPKRLLVDEANDWEADCIFVGARGMGRLERLLLGSVSTTIVQRASCSVEIVRARQVVKE
jgi:nucleotide-binding universal stress UspA family protein